MSNVTPYLSSCVLLFCQPVFSDHYTAHIMYEVPPLVVLTLVVSTTRVCTPKKRAKAHSCRHNAEYPMHDCTPKTVPETTQTGTVTKPRARRKDYNCAKEHSSRDSDEHNMHDERSHRSPYVLPLDCPYPSVPNNTQAGTVTNTTCTTKDHTARHMCYRSTAPTRVCQITLKQGHVPKNTQAGTVTNTACTTKDHTAGDVCCRSTAPTRVCQRTLKQGQ
ncbi:hypothetical protein Bbelb_302080 [Branchiostoma belcheri]|nr:hypothetical protein Bbelb_302080 [Branchiostoma belcheri]